MKLLSTNKTPASPFTVRMFEVEPTDVGKHSNACFGVYQDNQRRFEAGDVGRVIEVTTTCWYTVWSFTDAGEN